MRNVRRGTGLAVAMLAMALPAMANGSTYCVHQGGSCPAGQVDEGADLQQALDDAGLSSGNTVLVGPGTFTHDFGFTYEHGTPVRAVTVTGAGAGQTILESSAAHPAAGFVFAITTTPSSVLSGFTVHVRHADGGGLSLLTATASNIAVKTDSGGPGNQRALAPGAGATVEHSTIQNDTSSGCCPAAVFDNSGDEATLIDDTLQGGYYGISVAGAGTALTARDLRIDAPLGINVGPSASATIDGLLATLHPPGSTIGLQAYQGGSLVVRSATVIGADVPGSVGLYVEGAGADSSLTFNDSILRGFPVAWERFSSGSGTQALTLDNDDISGTEQNSASGTASKAADIDADPLFVNAAAGDFRLRFGSPAIDSGNACNSICQATPDLDGLIRPIDGNGDGTATRDMGAYEYGHRAPTVTAAASAPTATPGQAVTFTAAASDPDPGDAVALTWTLDDGTTGGGANVTHAFATPGTHTATVTATDSSGLKTSAAAAVAVATPPDRTAPTVGSIHLSHRTFRRGKHSARAAAKKRSPTGTTISFSLSEAATVRITFEKRDRHRHYKAVHARSVTIALKAGKPRLRFDGIADHHHRLSVGSYRLTLVATDAAGNRSNARTATFTIASR